MVTEHPIERLVRERWTQRTILEDWMVPAEIRSWMPRLWVGTMGGSALWTPEDMELWLRWEDDEGAGLRLSCLCDWEVPLMLGRWGRAEVQDLLRNRQFWAETPGVERPLGCRHSENGWLYWGDNPQMVAMAVLRNGVWEVDEYEVDHDSR